MNQDEMNASLDKMNKEFVIKVSVSVEGIPPDFIWYEYSSMIRKMGAWMDDFKKLVNVMEQRNNDNLKTLEEVMKENRKLKEEKRDARKES